MKIELTITSHTDKTIRFNVVINGVSTGELQTTREELTKLADLMFKDTYTIAA